MHEWHYNPKFTNIPIDEVFGKGPASAPFDQRRSFYIEFDQSKDVIEKFSVCGLDYESVVLQERPVDKIYESDDCKQYLEDFDYTFEPAEETVIRDQIQAYKQEYHNSKPRDLVNTKCSDSDYFSNEADQDEDDLNEACKQSTNAYKLKPSIISK